MNQFLPLIAFSLGVSASVLRRQGLDELGGNNGQTASNCKLKTQPTGLLGNLRMASLASVVAIGRHPSVWMVLVL